MSNTYIHEHDELLKEMTTLSSLLHGSWLERYSTCTKPDCACHSGKRHGPRYYLVVNDNGQQRQKYIPNSLVKKAQNGLAQHKRLQQIVDRITQINLILMKERNHESD